MSYFALYIPVVTFLCGILIAFLFSMVTYIEGHFLTTVGIVSVVLATAIVIGSWFNNEKKFRHIIRREVNSGKQLDERQGGGHTAGDATPGGAHTD